ncbi:hypothetical protein GLOIN_2v1778880 [Rhizophagus irregularis DAOM 181602=DAOM 197198]|nr:hypothetical protein GLOIN_2v1778880 [Rhizophagus irregularis DAOM 181602=DAOM 197198]
MDTLDQLTEVRERQTCEKIYNPKSNRMIIINGPAYRKLLCDGYMHWREERLLIPPLHELPILRRHLSFISYRIWGDREKRRQAHDHLQKGYNFSKEQAFALIPSQRTSRTKSQVTPKEGDTEAEVNICCAKSAYQVSDIIPEGEIIRETAQRIMRDSLSEKEVKLIAKALAETSPNPVACTSSLSRLQKELRKLNAPKVIIEATKIPGMTTLSNKIQKEKSLLCEDEGIHYLNHFSLELVKERLDSYDVSNTPDKQALADVMIMLCIRPAEIKDLRISNGGVTGYVKNQDQQDIPRVFRSLEKNEERAKQLLT